MRGRVGRAVMPRVLDVMESRSAAILRSLFEDTRLSLTRPVSTVVPPSRPPRRYAVRNSGADDPGVNSPRGRLCAC